MLKDLCFEIIQTCPNKCKFCSSNSSKDKTTIITLEDFKKTVMYFITHGGIGEISISGGEPFLHPDLFEMIKFCKDDDFKDEKVILSILKYITRLSTRCTPFGLFSGCTIGSLSNETRLQRIPLSIQRKTTIDNLLLGELIMKYEAGNKNKISYIDGA